MKKSPWLKVGLMMVLFFLIGLQSSIEGAELIPFHVQNQSPIVQIFGLPSLDSAAVLPAGKKEIRFVIDHASNYVDREYGSERLILDGETSRFALVGKYGFGSNLEAGIEIPYLIETGGFLDGFIESYHSFFGFPNGGRDQAPRNRLLYRYSRNGADLLKIDSSNNGFGDLKLTAGWQFFQGNSEKPAAISLRTALKIPTGNSDQLHGSGSTDLSLWLSASRTFKKESGDWTIFGAAGLMGMTTGNVLADRQRNEAGFGGVGAGWAPWSRVALKLQINGHTPFYKDSDLSELSGASAQLTAGGTITLSKSLFLDIGLTEDIVVRTAPDVVFHFALRSIF